MHSISLWKVDIYVRAYLILYRMSSYVLSPLSGMAHPSINVPAGIPGAARRTLRICPFLPHQFSTPQNLTPAKTKVAVSIQRIGHLDHDTVGWCPDQPLAAMPATARSVTCPICDKKFSRTDHLKRHHLRRKALSSHIGEEEGPRCPALTTVQILG